MKIFGYIYLFAPCQNILIMNAELFFSNVSSYDDEKKQNP